jgi:Uma2 family endonuclease
MAAPETAEQSYLLDHVGPWTEEEFFTLPVDRRVELVDGSLLVSPASRVVHQWLSSRLWAALNAASPKGLIVLEAVNVRTAPGRVLIPDLAVVDESDPLDVFIPASAVRTVIEIASPGNLAVDRALKPQLYAQAGIPTMLRIELEQTAPTAIVLELDGDRYREVRRVPPGELTELREPFSVSFDLAALIRR